MGSKQGAVGSRLKAVQISGKRFYSMRLCLSDVRKGFAFPALLAHFFPLPAASKAKPSRRRGEGSGPLNAKITGQIQADGSTIEKVLFQSLLNFYVTGNLYRPNQPGRYPTILYQSGHTQEGKPERRVLAMIISILFEEALWSRYHEESSPNGRLRQALPPP